MSRPVSRSQCFRLRSPEISKSSRLPLISILLCGLLWSPPAQAIEIPEPEPGFYAPTALALLNYNRRVCDDIAGRVAERWHQFPEGTAETERRIQEWVTESSLSDLAAGRAASDIVRDLLPQARSETDAETAGSLGRLHELETELCDTVALPLGPLEDFERRVDGLLERIQREEEELGRLLVVPEDILAKSLEPYLRPIQLAAFEAEAEYRDYLESLRPKPQGPTHQDLMVEWHRRYAAAAQPTKNALRDYLVARNANDTREMAKACREISAAVIPFLKQDDYFRIPVPQLPASKGYKWVVLESLQRAYKEMRELAINCSAGRSRETVEHLQAMQEQLAEAAGYLARFSLQP